MSVPIVYKLEHLKASLPRLRQLVLSGDIDAVEAMAEAFFRIALHRDTPTSEAVTWLLKARRIDGANPRYPYHLARICLAEGDLDGAAKWLKETYRYCRSSHRLWAHVSVLQQELNSRFKGHKDYEPDCLRLRADSITQAIKEGLNQFADDWISFVPPKSLAALEEEARRQRERDGHAGSRDQSAAQTDTEPAHRDVMQAILDPAENGVCRWSGIIDLEIERLLEDEPSNRGRDRIFPLLEQVVRLSVERVGGDTRFVTLAVQWLLSGYPVASVRRLMADFRGQTGALALLECVCRQFEIPLETLPARLSECLERNEIPPLIAALIHQRLLLWRPVTFRSSYAYRAARHLIGPKGSGTSDPEKTEQAEPLIKALIEAGKRIDVPQPTPISDIGEKEEARVITEAEACGELQRLENSYAAAASLLLQGIEFLKETDAAAAAIETEESFAVVRRNTLACQVFLEQLITTGSLGIERIERLLGQIRKLPPDRLDLALQTDGTAGSAGGFGSRLDAVKKNFNDLKLPTSFRNFLRRAERGVNKASSRFSSLAETASPVIINLTDKLTAVFPKGQAGRGGDAGAEREPAPSAPSNSLEDARAASPWEEIPAGVEGLTRTLELIDQKLDIVLKQNLETFEPYTDQQMGLPDLRLLQSNLLTQAAETYWRLGRYAEARSAWQKCLSLDRLSIPSLTNLAVSNTISAVDHARTLKSWRDCSEALYFLSVAAGTPRMAVAQRMEFHQKYASACSCGAFPDQKDRDEDLDWRTKLLELLNTPGLLSDFIAHKLAELLNRRLAISTPTLLLGVPRTGKQETRDKTKKQLECFIWSVTASLSPRVGPNFQKMCSDYLENALQSCTEGRNLTLARNRRYKSDQELLIHQLKDLYELKFRFFSFFFLVPNKGKRIEWEIQLQSVESLILLDSLNSYPIPADLDLIHSAVRGPAQRIGLSPEALIAKLDDYLSQVLLVLVNGIVVRQDRNLLDSIANALSRHPGFFRKRLREDQFKFLDDPVPFYPQEFQAQVDSPEQEDPAKTAKAIDLLETWCTRYPALTGPPRRIAVLLFRRDPKRAIKHLEKAVACGAFQEGVEQCRRLLRQTRISASLAGKDFQAARQHVLEWADENPEPEVLEQLLVVYSQWLNEKPYEIVKLITRLEEDFSHVNRGIRSVASTSGPVTTSASGGERDDPVIRKRDIIVNAILQALGKPSSPDQARKLLPALQVACENDSGNMSAMYLLAVCCFQLGSEEFQKSAADRGKKNFDKSHDIALNVSKRTSDRKLASEASVIVEEAKKILRLL